MTDKTIPPDSINDQAIRWAVEMAYEDITPAMEFELESWLAADTRHRGAYVRACAWMRAMDDAVAGAGAPEAIAPSVVAQDPLHPLPEDAETAPRRTRATLAPRKELVRWGGRAVAACAALAASVVLVVGFPLTAPSPQASSVKPGRVMSLADGSVATLSSDGKIAIEFSAADRQVTLVSGTATFDVARDKARPFVVRSGEVYAQATGTVYSVSRAGGNGGTVKVAEGSVLVWPRDDRDQAVLLHAGGSLTLDPGPRPSLRAKEGASVPSRLPPPELAQISLDNVSIKSAVARFNRINSTKIIIADAAIGEMTIIGLYRADDPKGFAEAVSAISESEIQYDGNKIVIKMKTK